MAKQTLFFESECNLSLSNGNILVTYPDTSTLQRPIEDIATVIIDHHSVHVTIPLLNSLSSSGVSVVFCNDNHMPVGMLQDLRLKLHSRTSFSQAIGNIQTVAKATMATDCLCKNSEPITVVDSSWLWK